MNTTNKMTLIVNLSASHTEESAALKKILTGKLKRLGRGKSYSENAQRGYWPADYFGLNQSELFNGASPEQQDEILRQCSDHLLREAYFIEKSGLTFCAKMVLLAETTEVAQAYSLMGADEATHLQWITPYVPLILRERPGGEFVFFLKQLIEQGDANCLMYLLQVILEGWGLHHYKDLSVSCQQAELRSVLIDIVRDEALHQHTGAVLFQPQTVSHIQNEFIQDSLASFLEMIRVGPQAVVSHVDLVLGGLSKARKIQLIEQISGPEITARKLKLLQRLMAVPGCEKWIEALDARKMFEPYLAYQCV
ncbi:MAG: ferritin-like domain-containing protein [Gammaproteobacteria bacterium]|nr:ferritin-like domain-containing protein [Gammaproteobacteria bacterium]